MSPIQQSRSMGLTGMLRRRRSAGHINNNTTSQPASPSALAAPIPSPPPPAPPALSINHQHPQPSTSPTANPTVTPHRIRLVPHLESRRSLKFEAIARDIRDGDAPLRIGRFTDRSGLGLTAVNALGTNKLAFKSKVVSRAHAEIWVDSAGKFWIKDTKSSSGTFLNHSRLSPANTESRPFPIKDGDVLQLGVDYQGGTEDIYKSVKIRIEIGREWQQQANAFNTAALKNLKQLAVQITPSLTAKSTNKKPTPLTGIPDCCICLFSVTIHQALFIAPCSHTFHYKCIRPLLESHHPGFSCPLCRTFADLDEDVEVDHDEIPGIWNDDGEDSAVDDDPQRNRPPPTPISVPTNSFHRDGTETEVEVDNNTPPQPNVSRFTQVDEEDGDMLVDEPSGVVASGSGSEAAGGDDDGSAGGPPDDLPEDEDDHLHPDELGLAMVVDADATVGGKRKR